MNIKQDFIAVVSTLDLLPCQFQLVKEENWKYIFFLLMYDKFSSIIVFPLFWRKNCPYVSKKQIWHQKWVDKK